MNLGFVRFENEGITFLQKRGTNLDVTYEFELRTQNLSNVPSSWHKRGSQFVSLVLVIVFQGIFSCLTSLNRTQCQHAK